MPLKIVCSPHRKSWRTVVCALAAVIVSHASSALAISHEWGLRYWMEYGNLPTELAERKSNHLPIVKHLAEIDRLTAANQIDAAFRLLLSQTPAINQSSGIWALPIGSLPKSVIDLKNLPPEKSLESTAAFLIAEFASKDYVAKYLLADLEQWVGSSLPVSKGVVDGGLHWIGWPRIFLTDHDGTQMPLDSVSTRSDPTLLLVKRAAIEVFREAYLKSIRSTFGIGDGQFVPDWFNKLSSNQLLNNLRRSNYQARPNIPEDAPAWLREMLAIQARFDAGEISLDDSLPPRIAGAASCESVFKGSR